MQHYNFNDITNTSILPTTDIAPSSKNSSVRVKMVVTDKALPICAICLSLPEDPVTVCKNIETQFFKKHLLCRRCADSPIDGSYLTICPVCKQENADGPQFEADAAKFIAQLKLNSLYLCPNSCDNLIQESDINNHIANCSEKTITAEATSENKNYNSYKNITICADCKAKIPVTNMRDHSKNCLQSMTAVTIKTDTGLTTDLYVRKWLYNDNNTIANIFKHTKLEKVSTFVSKYDRSIAKCTFTLNSLYVNTKILKFYTYAKYSNIKLFESRDRKLYLYRNEINFNNRDKLLSIEPGSPKILYDLEIPKKYKSNYFSEAFGTTYKLTFNKQRFTIAIYPCLSANNNYIVCKKTFNQEEINTYNSMYVNKTAPQDFVDLIEFFSDNGIAKNYYVPKYGNDLKWKILVAVDDI